jgi:hypothetical protein
MIKKRQVLPCYTAALCKEHHKRRRNGPGAHISTHTPRHKKRTIVIAISNSSIAKKGMYKHKGTHRLVTDFWAS